MLRPDQHSRASGPHTSHAVQLPALFFWQDVVQEDALSPVQLLGVVDERDVLIEQRATCRDKTHGCPCYLCPQGGKHRTPNSFQCAVQESVSSRIFRNAKTNYKSGSLRNAIWIQEKGRCLATRFPHDVVINILHLYRIRGLINYFFSVDSRDDPAKQTGHLIGFFSVKTFQDFLSGGPLPSPQPWVPTSATTSHAITGWHDLRVGKDFLKR